MGFCDIKKLFMINDIPVVQSCWRIWLPRSSRLPGWSWRRRRTRLILCQCPDYKHSYQCQERLLYFVNRPSYYCFRPYSLYIISLYYHSLTYTNLEYRYKLLMKTCVGNLQKNINLLRKYLDKEKSTILKKNATP